MAREEQIGKFNDTSMYHHSLMCYIIKHIHQMEAAAEILTTCFSLIHSTCPAFYLSAPCLMANFLYHHPLFAVPLCIHSLRDSFNKKNSVKTKERELSFISQD